MFTDLPLTIQSYLMRMYPRKWYETKKRYHKRLMEVPEYYKPPKQHRVVVPPPVRRIIDRETQ